MWAYTILQRQYSLKETLDGHLLDCADRRVFRFNGCVRDRVRASVAAEVNMTTVHVFGGIVALLIFAYLVYALIKAEDF